MSRPLTARLRLSACLVLSGFTLAACASSTDLRIISYPEAESEQLIGRDVRVVTNDGRTLDFTVTQVDDDGLLGRHERVDFDEIVTIQERTINPAKLLGSAVGAVLGTAIGLLCLGLIYWGISGWWSA